MTTDLQVRKRISLNHNSSILNERKKLTTNPTEAILKVHRGVLYHNESALKVRSGLTLNYNESILSCKNRI